MLLFHLQTHEPTVHGGNDSSEAVNEDVVSLTEVRKGPMDGINANASHFNAQTDGMEQVSKLKAGPWLFFFNKSIYHFSTFSLLIICFTH